jgi:hypothetical protein
MMEWFHLGAQVWDIFSLGGASQNWAPVNIRSWYGPKNRETNIGEDVAREEREESQNRGVSIAS